MFRSPSFAGLPGLSTMLDDLPATRVQVATTKITNSPRSRLKMTRYEPTP